MPVKTPKKSYRQINAVKSCMLGNQSTESNGYVRILTGSSEVAGSAHAQYNLAKKTVENNWRNVGRPLRCNASQLPAVL